MLSLGKEPLGKDYPALFAVGTRDQARAIYRSDDDGKIWLRVNDEQHEYGRRFRCIAADPRIFGRVHFGTDGRGILYGEPANAQ
jgi:xyloglucan-specific exo-beta-1,4-glucanase